MQTSRVWVLTELYYPEKTSTGHFLTGIAEGLAARFRTSAVCSQPTYSARGQHAPWTEDRNGVRIIRCRSTRFDKDRLLGRMLNMVTFTSAAFCRLLLSMRRGDVVMAVTTPPTLPFVAAAAARLRGGRFVLLVHDVYPDVLVATGMASEASLLVRLAGSAMAGVYRRADRIIVLGRDMRRRIESRLPTALHDRVRIIPNWGDLDVVRPDAAAGARARADHGLDDRFIVQMMGNLGRTHGVDTVLDAARLMQSETAVHFQFVGWGSRAQNLADAVATEQLHGVRVHPPCSADDLGAYLNMADVTIIAFLPGMSGVSVPSRLYNILAAGRPVIGVCDPDSELAAVILEERVGWVVRPGRPDELADAIRHARAQPAERRQMELNARAAAERLYGRGVVADQYRRAFSELLLPAPLPEPAA